MVTILAMSAADGIFGSVDALDAASAPVDTSVDLTPDVVPVDYQSETTNPTATFSLVNIPPPPTLYVTPDDVIALSFTCSVPGLVIATSYRLLRIDGLITVATELVTLLGNRTSEGQHINLPEGFLLGVSVEVASGNVLRGQCYCSMGLQRGLVAGTHRQLELAADYLVTRYTLGWPGGPTTNPLMGPGNLNTYTPANPAAGTDLSYPAPESTRWAVRTIRFQLTTSAAAGLRMVQLRFEDGSGNGVYLQDSQTSQGPGTTQTYQASALGFQQAAGGGLIHIPIPDNFQLPLGSGWTTFTSALDAGDQYSNIAYYVEEWVD